MSRLLYLCLALPAMAMVWFVAMQTEGGPGEAQKQGYVIETDSLVATPQSGPHEGGGETTGYSFCSGAPDLELVFRSLRYDRPRRAPEFPKPHVKEQKFVRCDSRAQDTISDPFKKHVRLSTPEVNPSKTPSRSAPSMRCEARKRRPANGSRAGTRRATNTRKPGAAIFEGLHGEPWFESLRDWMRGDVAAMRERSEDLAVLRDAPFLQSPRLASENVDVPITHRGERQAEPRYGCPLARRPKWRTSPRCRSSRLQRRLASPFSTTRVSHLRDEIEV
jgi:hypothetical protein